jgi:hypothetical protein
MHLTNSTFDCKKFVLAILMLSAIAPHKSLYAGEPAGQRSRRAQREATSNAPAPRDVLGFTPGDDRKLASKQPRNG